MLYIIIWKEIRRVLGFSNQIFSIGSRTNVYISNEYRGHGQ